MLRGAYKRTQQLTTMLMVVSRTEAMHSGTVILRKDSNAHAQTLAFSLGQHCSFVVVPCKRRNMLGPAMLRVVGQQCCVRLHGPFICSTQFLHDLFSYFSRASHRNNHIDNCIISPFISFDFCASCCLCAAVKNPTVNLG